jgi:hypothetical protein
MDTEILGLKFELIDYLQGEGVNWFEHFSEVESNMTERTLCALITCGWEEIKSPFERWAMDNGFKLRFSPETGKAKFSRKISGENAWKK